tara:strand:+ start:800 stop:1228 length:429 start_codon:yes stop_codon:yes gene_type:complete
MNKLRNLIAVSLIAILCSCSPEDINEPSIDDYAYHSHILEPQGQTKSLNDLLLIDVLFESHVDEYIHNINVRLYSSLDSIIFYNKPINSKIDSPKAFHYLDTVVLSNSNGFEIGKQYILEARVWAQNEGESEAYERDTFLIQ